MPDRRWERSKRTRGPENRPSARSVDRARWIQMDRVEDRPEVTEVDIAVQADLVHAASGEHDRVELDVRDREPLVRRRRAAADVEIARSAVDRQARRAGRGLGAIAYRSKRANKARNPGLLGLVGGQPP